MEKLLNEIGQLLKQNIDYPNRWSGLGCVLRDGRFDVAYSYPDEIDPEENIVVRRKRSVRRHFGGKPIVYPPLLDDELPTYDLS